MKNITCCINCSERYRIVDGAFIEDCHDHCERYKKEKQEHDEYKKANRVQFCRAIFDARPKFIKSKFNKK